MTWTAFHRRGEVLREVVETIDARRDGRLPLDVPGVAETFRDELDLLAALHLKWHARLSGNIERALMDQPMDLEAAVIGAWRRAAGELPGLRLVMDHYRGRPTDREMAAALARAREKEWSGLAVAAGIASDGGARAARVGRRVEEAARAGIDTTLPPTVDEPDSPSLVERIKAVLAA